MGYCCTDTLTDAIEEFLNKTVCRKREYNKRDTVLRKGLAAELENRGKEITIHMIRSGKANHILEEVLLDTMTKLRIDKSTVFEVFKKFFSFLNLKYSIRLDIEDYLKRPLKDKKERQIDILKQLHAKPMSKEELADIYNISSKTLKTDLNELENGTEFLGQCIKINLEMNRSDGSVGYKSTVHPVFLALNMMEAYALTAGLKKISQGTAYEHIFNDIADSIYSQLSPYGQNLINQ